VVGGCGDLLSVVGGGPSMVQVGGGISPVVYGGGGRCSRVVYHLRS
jgi:hypothetical protein